MSTQPLMVMPPIYRFPKLKDSQARTWGWHRAREVFAVINNLRDIVDGKPPLDVEEMAKEYLFLKPDSLTLVRTGEGITGGGEHVDQMPARDNWIEMLTAYDYFMPAKIGMLMLEAVKNPNKAKIRAAVAKLTS
ncbi:MAG: hypothetical protein Q8P17_03265 [bacterium]|nr:hypothetical protein [bacterium]